MLTRTRTGAVDTATAGDDAVSKSIESQLSGDATVALLASTARRRTLVLYVGGTIGMKKNAEGALEPCAGYLTEEMRAMRELQESDEMAPFDIIEYEELLDSSDMNAADYQRIARDIESQYEAYSGFLVAHGTDTMHFTASALSFLLHNLAKPVIITGAMVPLAEPYNDARRNLVISMMIASDPRICEVCVFFNDSLFRGNRCDKIYHTYGAFHSPNYPPLGMMKATEFYLREYLLLSQPTGALAVRSNLKGQVLSWHLHPDADVDTLIKLIESSREGKGDNVTDDAAAAARDAPSDIGKKPLLDGIVLVLNGIGKGDDVCGRALRRIDAAATARGVVVCLVPREGRGSFTSWELRRAALISPRLIFLGDMCLATAEVKMMYLFGKEGSTPEDVAAMMPENLRGEVTPQRKISHL